MRLPSFNDFSPGILGSDLRPCLQVVSDLEGNDDAIIAKWVTLLFDGKVSKRSSTNVPATLRSTGLTTGVRPLRLSDFGRHVLDAPTSQEASLRFVQGIIRDQNGMVLLDALGNLTARRTPVTKDNLKLELTRLGIEALSTNTTDASTLKNWMTEAGLVTDEGAPMDAAIKAATGIALTERDEFNSMPLAQQVFLNELRKRHEVSAGPYKVADILKVCLSNHPHLFDQAQFARKVRKPLETEGWLIVTGLAGGKQGGRSGNVEGSAKLLAIPIDHLMPDFTQVVPADLRKRINTPLEEIKVDLFGTDKNKGGIALELLAVRMIIDLDLSPRHFRLRSAQSAHAEVDVVAEGAHLHFSRWTFQCKRHIDGSSGKVSLADVAKEVGIAIFARAHVVVMVTTSKFSKDAKAYADEISRATPLQFVFLDGAAVRGYLNSGALYLREYFGSNARSVLSIKQEQPLPTEEE